MATSAAFGQLQTLLKWYGQIFPMWTFPFLPLIVAAFFQAFAWMSGPIFLSNYTLVPRIAILLLFACGEYIFMSPTMNAGVEVLKMSEPLLVVIYQVVTLVVFMFVQIFIFKKPFHMKYLISFILLSAAIYVAYK